MAVKIKLWIKVDTTENACNKFSADTLWRYEANLQYKEISSSINRALNSLEMLKQSLHKSIDWLSMDTRFKIEAHVY
jgi:hypothetical protein